MLIERSMPESRYKVGGLASVMALLADASEELITCRDLAVTFFYPVGFVGDMPKTCRAMSFFWRSSFFSFRPDHERKQLQ